MNDNPTGISPAERYLDLLKHALTFSLWPEPLRPIEFLNQDRPLLKRSAVSVITAILRLTGYQLARDSKPTWEDRRDGCIWPYYADTMLGLTRLTHLQRCVETVLEERVPGDLIEAGVWRGGGCIFMRGVLAAYEVTDRLVYVADSFRGFPAVDAAEDIDDLLYKHPSYIAVSADTVRDNFRRYGLLDSQVVFLEGWFNETLPSAPIKQLAILRLDGDMYRSTMDSLVALYPKLSPGGFCVIDDYGALDACRGAVEEYRAKHGITTDIQHIDSTGVFWRKPVHP